MRVQLWSYNYDPEPTGIAPLSTLWARGMAARGHDVTVVAAHPHYPEPAWGRAPRPYRERRDGIPVIRLPLKIGRSTSRQRLAQELSFVTSLSVTSPLMPATDLIVAVSPSFPALVPAMVTARLRRVPWVLWLQDILPDGAVATGILDAESKVVRAAQRLEQYAYRSAARVVVISRSFEDNLRRKGVPAEKLVRIYNAASLPVRDDERPRDGIDPSLLMTMGNIGYSQGLTDIVRAFEASSALEKIGARFMLVGDGVAGDEVRAAIRSSRVKVTGVLLDQARVQEHLLRASVATVTQRYEGEDFNVPSKLMNFMGHGLPVLACVRPDSEVARLVEESHCGWVVSSAEPGEWADRVAHVMSDREELERRSRAALTFARTHLAPDRTLDRFEALVQEVVAT